MTKNVEGISLKKSKRVIDGKPNLPTPDKLVEGEIAINYAEGYETISTKNESGVITAFSSDDYYTKKKLGSGFTDENSAKTVTDAIGETVGELEAHTASTSHMNATEKENLDSLAANISAISGITAAKVESWDESSVSSHTHDNKAALDAITGNVGTMAYENAADYTLTSTTDALNTVVTAHTANTDIHVTTTDKTYWNNKVGYAEYNSTDVKIYFYKSNTETATSLCEIDASSFVVDGMIENVELVASGDTTALVITWNTDAGSKVITLDVGDIFEADNYYTKSETSGATEIATGLAEKLAISDFNTYSAATDTLINSKASQSDLDTLSGTVTAHTADTNVHMNATEKENLDSLATNIAAISGITAAKIADWDDAVLSAHNHDNKAYLDTITGNVGTMAYENAADYTLTSTTDALNTVVTAHTADTDIHITSAERTAWNDKLDIDDFNTYSGAVDTLIGTKASQSDLDTLSGTVTAHTADTDIHITSAERTAWNGKVDFTDISGYADSVIYNSTSKYVEFYHGGTGGTKVFEFDAAPFIIDGMVEDVKITGVTSGDVTVQCLVVSFNTDAGKQNINIPLTDIFDPNNYYSKSETSGKTELSTAFGEKLNISDFNTYSGAVDTLIGTKASQSDLEALSGTVTGHTADTDVHVTTGDKTTWNAVTAKTDNNDFTAHTADTSHMTATEKENLDSLAGNIAAISGITSTKVGNWDDAATNSHTHSNKAALDAITGSVGTMAYENKTSYSSATEVATALGTGFTVSSVTEVIESNERAISAALNVLNESKADTATTIAGYGITDAKIESQKITLGSNNVTVSSSTQISTALDNKQDKVAISAGTGNYSLIMNQSTNNVTGKYSVAEGRNNTVSGDDAHAEGSGNTATGNYAHVEGKGNSATTAFTHAEGSGTTASGSASHAEGIGTTAGGNYSHSEGSGTTAGGSYSHAEGSGTVASGNTSHAEGYRTIAYNQAEHACGRFNNSVSAESDTDDDITIFTVGNGNGSSARHNAVEVRRNGDVYFTSGGTKTSPQFKLQDKLSEYENTIQSLISRVTSLENKVDGVVAIFNVTSTTVATKIAYSGGSYSVSSNFDAMEIDGVRQQNVVGEYTFSTTGNHMVKYTLHAPTAIGNSAFKNCVDMISITIPEGVMRINANAFEGCTSIEKISLPDTVLTIGYDAFRGCTSLTALTMANNVTDIGSGACSGCTALTNIVIPESVTAIGSKAFGDCSNLNAITSVPVTAPTIQNDTFSGVSVTGRLTAPSGGTGYNEWLTQLGGGWTDVQVVNVEYLQSSGGSRINTGFIPQGNGLEFGGEFTLVSYPTGDQWLGVYGAYTGENNNAYRVIRYQTDNDKLLVFNRVRAGGGGTTVPMTFGQKNTFRFNDGEILFNGVTYENRGTQGSENTNPLYLFISNTANARGANCKFYSFYVKRNSEYIMNLIPVRIDTVGYMLDTISGQLFGAAEGYDPVIVGPDV